MRRLGYAAAGSVLAGLFYLVLIDTRELPELYALIVVALLAGLAFAVSVEQGLTEARMRASWLARAWRPLVRVPRDIVLVTQQALAQLVTRQPRRGQLRAVPFRTGESAEDVGRSALTESLGSFAPNTIVIGVDAQRHLLLVHQLRHDGDDEELDVLRLG